MTHPILSQLSPEQLAALSPDQIRVLAEPTGRQAEYPAETLEVETAFERYRLPDLADASHSQVSAQWKAAEYLDAWWASAESLEYRTVSPRVDGRIACGDVTKDVLAAFRFWLLKQPVRGGLMSRRTANKHTKAIVAILRAVFDAGDLRGVPRIADLDQNNNAPKLTFSDADIDALLAAVGGQDWPSTNPPLWWATAIIGYRTYGFRTEELCSYTGRSVPISDANLFLQPMSPADGAQTPWEYGWLQYVPAKQRRKKRDPVTVPLSRAFREHVDACREEFGSGESRREIVDGEFRPGPLLPMPRTNHNFYESWRALRTRAGIDERLSIQHFRKTMATAWNYQEDGLAELIGGWAKRSIVAKHYANHESRLIRAFENASYPASFDRRVGKAARQGELFDLKPPLRSRLAIQENDVE